MSEPGTPLILGTSGQATNPALEIANLIGPTSGWTQFVTSDVAVAGVSGTVLAIGTQATTGALTAALLTIDGVGNMGVAGSLSISGAVDAAATAPTIGSAAGAPSASPSIPPASLYLRSDSDETLGSRFFQYVPQPNSSSSGSWLEVPVGLGIFNIKEYGAAGDPAVDATAPIQQAITDAENQTTGASPKGALVYVPPGQYPVSGSLLVTGANNLTICGAGSSSQIILAPGVDTDILYVSGGANGLNIADLALLGAWPPGTSGAAAATGSCIHIAGGGGQFVLQSIVTSAAAFGLYATNTGGAGQLLTSTIEGNTAGIYMTAGVQLHHSEIKGTSYGMICDGCNGIKMTNVSVSGALPLAFWNTSEGGQGQNSVYGYDVTPHYLDVMPATPDALTSQAIPLSGSLTAYSTMLQSGMPYIPSRVYIRGGGFAVSGVVDSSSGTTLDFTSTFQSSFSGTIPSGASVWGNPPYYPSQIAGEGEGSASLVANSAQIHLVDCDFSDGTVVGGNFPGSFATPSASFLFDYPFSDTVTVPMPSGNPFVDGDVVYILDGLKGADHQLSGVVSSVSSTGMTLSLLGVSQTGATVMASGAFASKAFTMAGVAYAPWSPQPDNTYPFAPNDVTIQGGTWSSSGPSMYAPGSVILTEDALGLAAGATIVVSDGNFTTAPDASGFCIDLASPVSGASIVGNNVAPGSGAAGAISIGASGYVNCQSNLIVGGGIPASALITWPSTVGPAFSVAGNPGFNPTGLYSSLTPPSASPWTATNVYGVPGTFYVSPGSSTITSIKLHDFFTGIANDTDLKSGGFHVGSNGQIEIAWSGATPPSAAFFGD